jgi:hypothetical protein
MRMTVTVVSLFGLPLYCLHKTFMQQNERTSQFAPNSKGFQLRDFAKSFLSRTIDYSSFYHSEVGHFSSSIM